MERQSVKVNYRADIQWILKSKWEEKDIMNYNLYLQLHICTLTSFGTLTNQRTKDYRINALKS